MAVIKNNLRTVKLKLEKYNFPEFLWVYSRPTISDLIKPGKRCGIYILHFRNSQFYIGQAIDVVRRFVQHVKTHEDIQEICFKEFPIEILDQIETDIVSSLEKNKITLRNISLTSIPKGNSDLDLIIPRKKQEQWLENSKSRIKLNAVIDNPILREKYALKYQKLLRFKNYNDRVLPFLKQYFKKCIIQPENTELSFWSLTCLPYQGSQITDVCRVNLFWCEVLTIFYDKKFDEFGYSFHLTKSILTKSYLKQLKLPSLIIDDHYYPKGGPDQFKITVYDFDEAMFLLKDELVLLAIKTFNLRQMQKGSTVFGRYHCIDLARQVLGS